MREELGPLLHSRRFSANAPKEVPDLPHIARRSTALFLNLAYHLQHVCHRVRSVLLLGDLDPPFKCGYPETRHRFFEPAHSVIRFFIVVWATDKALVDGLFDS